MSFNENVILVHVFIEEILMAADNLPPLPPPPAVQGVG
jgi:hypothetical protein